MPVSTVSAAEFSSALLKPDEAAPRGIVGPDGDISPKRFNVYRNNVVVSLSEALAQTFPAVQNLLGDEYFQALARAFVTVHPPQSPVLLWYGADFPAFLEAFPPLAGYPYLADVARLEWAWLQAYHTADCGPLDPSVVVAIAPEQLGAARFEPHPASALIVSEFPILDLVRQNRFEKNDTVSVDLKQPQQVLVTRPELDVKMTFVQHSNAVFMDLLLKGRTLQEAAEASAAADPEFSLSGALSDCFSSGAFKDIIVQ
ncbi:DUF2063 domain-containing protein [Roseibium denhamense]|uniref:DNA-binding domain-containing protein n=1 Tax=Roseibium denhamense TaxID=76305 RepID=A0ABY1NKF5_9HYPH|nr:DNA-binding domain-containing protein [Roseibium denhamense]MTI06839.1 DUF2063 domain-containing protein [Roseibium denhamense]SMP11863.1 Putative DNA-binding domain-containing protein [Roseibium denhamense]